MTADAVPSVGGPTDSPPSGRRPAVSVVVPTYRRAGLLAVTLDSLDRLEHPPLEILVCTDDWSDGSDAVAARPGVTPLDTRRQGAAGHRNAGWMAAQGDVVAFIDDDCAASPGWLGALIEPFRDPDVVLVQGRTVPAATPSRRERSIDIPCEYGLYETCNIAYRRQALEDAGGFDESLAERFGGRPFGEDADLAYRLRRTGQATAFAAGAVVTHHVFPASLRQALEEEWRRGYFPRLIRLVPEVESIFPGPRFLMREQSLRAQLLLAGLVIALVTRRPFLGAALAIPYLRWARARFPGGALPEQVLYDLVASVSLVIGSARARRLLL